jgi:NAD(P)-dependent dehydrogenase (short-subunit alcohol dehydrogenase family)
MPYVPFDLTGKVALVTGGNGGIGLGMAKAMAEAGADVAIWGRDEKKLDAATEVLLSSGGRVDARVVDVTDLAAVRTAVDEVVGALGRIDAAFANAGAGGRTRFLDLDDETYRRVLATNLDGTLWTLREAGRHMVERAKAGDAGGSLVGVSSLSAVRGAPTLQSYAAAKGAIVSLTKSIAVEWARYGVRANTILPGWIQTEMTTKSFERDEVKDAILSRVPVSRWGQPDDFGGIAVYLASDASRYHTGGELVIDGGYTTT